MKQVFFILCAVLVLSSGALAVDVIQPDEVALVVNTNDSTDTDNNGILDWQQIINKYAEIHPLWDSSNVIGVKTRAFPSREWLIEDEQYGACNPAVSYGKIPWGFLHHQIDTLADTSQKLTGVLDYDYSSHNLPTGDDYVLMRIGKWLTDNQKWGDIKVLVLVKGMPYGMKRTPYYTCQYRELFGTCSVDSRIVTHSLDETLMYYLHPGIEDSTGFSKIESSGRRVFYGRCSLIENPVNVNYASSDSGFSFTPGALSQINTLPASDRNDWTSDVMPLWVLTSRLDGVDVEDVLHSIEAAAWPAARFNPESGQSEFGAIALIDGTNDVDFDTSAVDSLLNFWAGHHGNPGNRNGLLSTFGSERIFYDAATGSVGSMPCAITQNPGCVGDTIPPDPVIFYMSAGTHDCSNSCDGPLRPSNMNYWINGTLGFEVANGALTVSHESFSAIVIWDTAFCGNSPTCASSEVNCWTPVGGGSGRISGAIKYGFSYALGYYNEPALAGFWIDSVGIKQMGIPNNQFIKLINVAKKKQLWVNIALGDPLGTWIDTIRPPAPVAASVSFHNVVACLEDSVSLSFTTPHIDDMDSAFVIVYSSTPFNCEVDTAVAVHAGPDQVITFDERYADLNIDSVVIVLLDRVGNPNTQVYYSEGLDYTEAPGTTDADRVLLVVNPYDTDDTDNNGTPDWRDIVLQYAITHPTWDTSNVCSVRTYAGDGNLWHPQSVYERTLHYDVDTSHVWDDYPTIELPSNQDYILQKIAAWFDADCQNRWGTVKYVALVKGMPLKTRHNQTNWGGNPNTAPDSGNIYKSIDAAIATFIRPNLSYNGYFTQALNGAWTNGWKEAQEVSSEWEFTPGTYYNKWPEYSATKTDSLLQWVMVTRLDGEHVDDVRGMITRAARPAWRYDSGSSAYVMDHWAVVDNSNSSDSLRRPWTSADSKSATFVANAVATFGIDQILRDSTGGPFGGDPDSLGVRFGWSGSRNIPSGESVLFYFTAATLHTPGFPRSMYWYHEFDLAPGAIAITPEPYAGWSMRDTAFAQGAPDDNALLIEGIANGFTYAIGDAHTPRPGKAVRPYNIPKAIGMPGCTFAMAAQMSHDGMGYQSVALGDPIGVWRDETAPGELENASCEFFRLVNCLVDSVSLIFTTPDDDDLDSIFVFAYRSSSSGTATDTLAFEDTGPGETYSYQLNAPANWTYDSVRVIVADRGGNLQSAFYFPEVVWGTLEVPVLELEYSQDFWVSGLGSTWTTAWEEAYGYEGDSKEAVAFARVYTKANGDYVISRVYVESDTVNTGDIAALYAALPTSSASCPCLFDSVSFLVTVDTTVSDDKDKIGALCWVPKSGFEPHEYALDDYDLWRLDNAYFHDTLAADTIAFEDFSQYAVDDSAHTRRLVFTTAAQADDIQYCFDKPPAYPYALYSALIIRSDARNLSPGLDVEETGQSVNIYTSEHESATPPQWIIYYSWKPAWE